MAALDGADLRDRAAQPRRPSSRRQTTAYLLGDLLANRTQFSAQAITRDRKRVDTTPDHVIFQFWRTGGYRGEIQSKTVAYGAGTVALSGWRRTLAGQFAPADTVGLVVPRTLLAGLDLEARGVHFDPARNRLLQDVDGHGLQPWRDANGERIPDTGIKRWRHHSLMVRGSVNALLAVRGRLRGASLSDIANTIADAHSGFVVGDINGLTDALAAKALQAYFDALRVDLDDLIDRIDKLPTNPDGGPGIALPVSADEGGTGTTTGVADFPLNVGGVTNTIRAWIAALQGSTPDAMPAVPAGNLQAHCGRPVEIDTDWIGRYARIAASSQGVTVIGTDSPVRVLSVVVGEGLTAESRHLTRDEIGIQFSAAPTGANCRLCNGMISDPVPLVGDYRFWWPALRGTSRRKTGFKSLVKPVLLSRRCLDAHPGRRVPLLGPRGLAF